MATAADDDEADDEGGGDAGERAVPLYHQTNELAALWAERRHLPGSVVVDLGCGSGATLDAIGRRLADRRGQLVGPMAPRLVGVDRSARRLARAADRLAWVGGVEGSFAADLVEAELAAFEFPVGSGMVLLNYTLQLLPAAGRQSLLTRAVEALRPGGVLFVTAKVGPYLGESAAASEATAAIDDGVYREQLAASGAPAASRRGLGESPEDPEPHSSLPS